MDIVQLLVVRPEMKLLVASSDGKGFVTSGEATLAETRKGKQLVNLRPGAKVAVVRADPEGADAVAVVGENRKMLVFPLARAARAGARPRRDFAALSRRRPLRRHRIPPGEGLSWALGGESGRVRTETDLTSWRAARGAAGRMPPIGFPRNNRFVVRTAVNQRH